MIHITEMRTNKTVPGSSLLANSLALGREVRVGEG